MGYFIVYLNALLVVLTFSCKGEVLLDSSNAESNDSESTNPSEIFEESVTSDEPTTATKTETAATNKANTSKVVPTTKTSINVSIPKFESLSYQDNNIVFTALNEIISMQAIVAGPSNRLFKISPPLPTGLLIDELTGTISGTPLNPSPVTTHSVSVENDQSIIATSIQIAVIDNLPTSFVYQPTVRNLKFKLRTPAISPDTVGVHQTGSYAINPELPEGLAIDSTSGVISGRPLEKMELTNFTVTFSNSGGERQASLQISISDEYLDLSTISSTRDVNGVQTPMNLAFSAGFGGLTVVGDYLYMFGGAHNYQPWQNHTNRIQRAPLSDPTAWTGTGGLLPYRTAWVPAVTIDDKIFLYGNIYGTDQKSIFSANVATPDVWTDTGFDLPENSANHLIYVASDNVYILTANKIFVAPRTNPANMVDSGATNLPYFAHKNYIEFEDYLYVPEHTGGLVKRASKENPLVWETVCSDSTLAGGDNYTLTLVGSTVYYLGGHDYTGTWSAPIDDLCNWTQSAYPIPQNSWGNSQAIRVGDFFYIFGGLNASYVGHEKITRAAIKVRYD